MYLCITVNYNKCVLALSVKALTDEANKFTDNANKNLLGLRTTYVDIIMEFALLPSTGFYMAFIIIIYLFICSGAATQRESWPPHS
jgi:hypothetical protein